MRYVTLDGKRYAMRDIHRLYKEQRDRERRTRRRRRKTKHCPRTRY